MKSKDPFTHSDHHKAFVGLAFLCADTMPMGLDAKMGAVPIKVSGLCINANAITEANSQCEQVVRIGSHKAIAFAIGAFIVTCLAH